MMLYYRIKCKSVKSCILVNLNLKHELYPIKCENIVFFIYHDTHEFMD